MDVLIDVRKAESRKAGYIYFELTSILDSLNGFTAQIFLHSALTCATLLFPLC